MKSGRTAHRAARLLSLSGAALFRLLELAGQDDLETFKNCVRFAPTLALSWRSGGPVGERLQQPWQREA